VIDSTTQIYCCGPCSTGSNGNQYGGHTIRRNDTCPVMEIEVRTKNGDGVDLTNWTAESFLFALTYLSNDLADNTNEVWVDDTINIRRGDDIRVESLDGSEWLDVTGVDRTLHSLTVDRGQKGTIPNQHVMDTPLYVSRGENIPTSIEMLSYASGFREDIVYVQDGNKSDDNVSGSVSSADRIKRTVLTVHWRIEDTAIAGGFFLQVNLRGPNGERLTLPRNSPGYPITIVNDADNLV